MKREPTDEETKFFGAMLKNGTQTAMSRAQVLKTAAAGLAFAAVPGSLTADLGNGRASFQEFPFFPQTGTRYQTEQVQTIVNAATTLEHLAVSGLAGAIGNASRLGFTGLVLSALQAALAEEYYHLVFLRDTLGGVPTTMTFTLPNPKIATDPVVFLTNLEGFEDLSLAAYMAATREFAEAGQPTLAKMAFQLGAVEGEHRAMVRAALAISGDATRIPPNNKAFETDLLLYVGDALTLLGQLGLVGGTGPAYTYPGDAAVQALFAPVATKVVQRSPNNATSSVPATGDLTKSIEAFTVAMLGSNETGGGDPNGKGTAMVTIDAVNNQVTYTFNVTGITLPATASHIHKAPAGTSGPVVVPFSNPPGATGYSTGVVSVDPALIADIVANPQNYYVNVHTPEYPGGALRGQLM